MENEMNRTNEPNAPSAQDVFNQASGAFEETKRHINHAYEKSAGAIHESYDQAVDYGRKNPGKSALIAFGIGVGVGMLFLSSGRRGRFSRYGEPLVDAFSRMATEFVRGL